MIYNTFLKAGEGWNYVVMNWLKYGTGLVKYIKVEIEVRNEVFAP